MNVSVFAMSEALNIALAVTLGGIVGPVIMALVVGWIAHRERATKWAHDEALLAATHENTAAIEVGNDRLVEVAEVANQTHALVNSDMTAARSSELDQAKATLVVLRKVVALDAYAGRQSDPEDIEAIHQTVERIAELTKIVADRLATQKAIDDKAAADLAAVETLNGAS